MAIKLAVFDIAGTTVADEQAVSKAFRKAFQQKGLMVSPEMVYPLMGYRKTGAIKSILEALKADTSETHVQEIHELFVNAMLEYYEYSPEVQPMPGAEETMWDLKEQGIFIALNTGFSRDIADVIIDRMQWKEMGLVDDYIASDEVAEGRPHPAMIHTLMKRAGISDPAQVIKTGDTEVDINEGRNAQCLYSIAVTTGAFTRQELELHHPDYILDNLSELPAILGQHA